MQQGQACGSTYVCIAFHTRCLALRAVSHTFGFGLKDAEAQVDQGGEQL